MTPTGNADACADLSLACGSGMSMCDWFIQTELHALRPVTRPSWRRRPERTRHSWKRLRNLFIEERKKGMLGRFPMPVPLRRTRPGTLTARQRNHRRCSRPDAPLKRPSLPNGGLRMVINSPQSVRLRAEPGGS